MKSKVWLNWNAFKPMLYEFTPNKLFLHKLYSSCICYLLWFYYIAIIFDGSYSINQFIEIIEKYWLCKYTIFCYWGSLHHNHSLISIEVIAVWIRIYYFITLMYTLALFLLPRAFYLFYEHYLKIYKIYILWLPFSKRKYRLSYI